MGRTFRQPRDFEEESYSSRNKRNSKHSRNIPGRGMRVLNEYDEDLDDDSDEYLDDEHYANTSQHYEIRRK